MLSNVGTAALNWTAGADVDWLTVEPSAGTLQAAGVSGDSQAVVVSVAAGAAELLRGAHSGVITFTNQNSGVSELRGVSLEITGLAGED